MWLGHDDVTSAPSTWTRTRSSARPWIAGRLEIPPAPLMLTPGTSCRRRALSLVAARCEARSCSSRRVVVGDESDGLGAVTVTGASIGGDASSPTGFGVFSDDAPDSDGVTTVALGRRHLCGRLERGDGEHHSQEDGERHLDARCGRKWTRDFWWRRLPVRHPMALRGGLRAAATTRKPLRLARCAPPAGDDLQHGRDPTAA